MPNNEKYDLIIEVKGGCSIPGIELYYMLEGLFREKGFKNIGLEGLTEKERHGWDGFVSEESVKIKFNSINRAAWQRISAEIIALSNKIDLAWTACDYNEHRRCTELMRQLPCGAETPNHK